TELEKYKTFNDRTVDYEKLEHKLHETLGLLAQKDIDIKEGLKLKAYEILVVKEKHDELVKQGLLTKSHYEGLVKDKTKIPHDQSDPANSLVPDKEETLTLERESQEKLNKDLVKPYDYTKLNSLYEIFKPSTREYLVQLARSNEIRKKMWRKSFVKTKPNIFKNIDFLPVSKSISKSRQSYNVMTNNINHLREIIDQAWVKHSKDHYRPPTAHDIDILIKTCLMPLALKTQNDSFSFVHELKQEMYADLKYVESFEKEVDELESDKAEFSNMYDMLLQECVSNDLSKQTEFVSKEVYTELLRSFAKLEKHLISLELALQQCQEQMKNDTVCKEKASNVFQKEREQYFKIQDLKAQLQDKNIAICELKKLIEKCKGKSVETKFDKPSVVRQPNAQRIPKPSVLGKPAPFSDSLERKKFSKKKSDPKTNEYSRVTIGLLYEGNLVGVEMVDSTTMPIRDLQGNDLLTGNRGSDLYTISLQETTSSTPICLMAKASPTQAWLWHRRLSHLNFDYINLLSKKDVVIGLPKLKYVKDQLCSSCEVSKAKRSSFKTKNVPSSKGRLNLLHLRIMWSNVTTYSDYWNSLSKVPRMETPEVLKISQRLSKEIFKPQ
ncbi:retrovirus-related pol polyprotein from transposon TNT 1-94, partial [Tanacetum coccineum]